MDFEVGNFDILTEDQAAELFSGEASDEEEVKDETPKDQGKQTDDDEPSIEEINPDDLFSEDVDGEKDTKDKEDTTSDKDDGDSPKDIYSSIASSLVDEGIFQNLDDFKIEDIKSVDEFGEFFRKQIKAQLDEEQRRISEALEVGVEPEEVQRYESSLRFLEGITESQLSDESDKGIDLRKRIIYQDYLNNGASKDKALKLMEMSFKNGTDVEDAKEALEGNKAYYKSSYDAIIEEGRKEAENEKKALKKRAEDLKKAITTTEEPIAGLKVDKTLRQRAYEVATKPVYKDPDTGRYYTELQKYELEHQDEFMHKLSIIYAATDGFQKLDGLVKGKITTETKKGLRELEDKLRGRKPAPDGSFDFRLGNDPESKAFRLAKEIDNPMF